MADFKSPLLNQWERQIPPTSTNDGGREWRYPGTATTGVPSASPVEGTWSLISRLVGSDITDDATWSIGNTAISGTSPYGYVSNFTLGIPASATILGVEVLMTYGSVFNTNTIEETVRLAWGTDAANVSVDNKAAGTTRTPLSQVTLGSPTDTWGSALTPAILNDTTFGVLFRAQRIATGAGRSDLRGIALRVSYSVEPDGDVRLTQEYAEVISQATRQIRVTQAYAEVVRSIDVQTLRNRRMVFFQGG